MDEATPNDHQDLAVIRSGLFYLLQPTLLVLVITYWVVNPTRAETYVVVVLFVQMVLGLAEHFLPARPSWSTTPKEKAGNAALVIALSSIAALVTALYAIGLAEPLKDLRAALNIDIWPHAWPLLVQLFMVFFLSEFLWYWMHRAEHKWSIVWRLSGHGAHHSFKRLGALNFGLNHPIEYVLIVLPSAIVELTFGVGYAAAGAAALTVTQASIAHANIALNTKWIGLFFTTNKYHICHHSMVIEESNTNYGCSAIIWDRLFGTFLDKHIDEAGTGPTEPTLWQKFLMPIQELEDTAIAPNRGP
jgi:sterol desaturase/sphingolipid hydroxylase (fatty acid hydroxylase superfamily)